MKGAFNLWGHEMKFWENWAQWLATLLPSSKRTSDGESVSPLEEGDTQDFEHVSNLPPIRRVLRFSLIVVAAFFGFFFVWGLLADLDTGAVAQGKMMAKTNTKSVQHLEGGIVSKITVEEGAIVKEGDLLIELDETQPKSRLEQLRAHLVDLLANVARLEAQRDNAAAITWPVELVEHAKVDLDAKKAMNSNQLLFESTTNSIKAQQDILKNRIQQINKQIESFTSQVQAGESQLKLIREEIKAVAYLEKQKLVDRPRLLALQREEARLEGDRGDHLGSIAKAQESIGETQQQLLQLMDDYRKETLSKLGEAQSNLDDVSEREKAAEDVLKRTKIIAPRSGMVVNLKTHTLGGVIAPGETVMDIVPSSDQLIIEAKISPLDIDVVHSGLKARIRLVAFKQRYSPIINGTVDSVSADAITEPNTQQTYYVARVTINQEDLYKLKGVKLDVGMPVQIMFVTDKRSFISYLLDPLRESLFRAFHEQ